MGNDARPSGAGTLIPRAPIRGRVLAATGACLVLVEYLLASLRFDVQPLRGIGGVWGLVGYAGAVAPATVVAPLLLLLIADRPLRADGRRLLALPPTFRATALGLSAHLTVVCGFFWLTHAVLEQAETATPPMGVGLLWFALAAGVVLTTVLAVFRIPLLVRVMRRRWPVLLLAAGLGLLTQIAGSASARLWAPLANVTLEGAARLLELLPLEVVYDVERAILGTETFVVEVAPECSGIEGLGLIVVFLGIYLWSSRAALRFPRVLWLIPLALLIVFGANIVRIAALIALGHFVSPEVAVGGFHSKAGWLFFCAIALGVVAVSRHTPAFYRGSRPRSAVWNPTAPYLVPLLALTATAMVTGLFATDFDFHYPARILAAALAIALYWRSLRSVLQGFGSWPALGIGLVVFAGWVAMHDSSDVGRVEAFGRRLAELGTVQAAVFVAFRVVGSSVVVPLVEELAFRGFLQRRLISPDFTKVPLGAFRWFSFLGTSLAFGLLHGSWFAGTLAGMAFSYAQYRRHDLMDAVVAHATANALIAAWVLWTGDYSLWL